MNGFEVLHTDSGSGARRGVLTTSRGKVETPAFCPVGTAGAVKGISPRQLEEIGAEIILANIYHLLLRPGVDAVEKLGGLHKFMAWDKPILTDSGGYQIFSLGWNLKRSKARPGAPPLSKVDDDGVEFVSHIDGAKIYLNAELATEIQNRLGADIIMCFDQCTPFPCEDSHLKKAVERTIIWAKRSKKAHANAGQLLFGIVQGGTDLELRSHCASELIKLDFDGYAIGGLSVGEQRDDMIRTVAHTAGLLPEDKPRYLMGVGMPADVLPTRNGRNAYAFTDNGPVRMRNNAHINDTRPIEAGCDCYCCKNFSRGTLRHFFNVGEMLGPMLVSLHNLRFYQRLMANIRQAIEKNEFSALGATD
ncbi:MAG: tRNA guanosine(34) transglycosylase Tgt [Planctomycetota bacterium]|jgi:queuine tRNA-ribosyltransferase